jgi:diguanylate cyclase (GGDEF)-like protein
MSILVVDDSGKQRVLLQHYLKLGGFTDVILTGTAREALAHLRVEESAGPCDVDMILMDIVLPDINGIEVCHLISSNERLRDIPIIMVTGMADPESLELAFNAGAMDYVVKPVNQTELLVRVRSLMRLRREMELRRRREQQLVEVTSQLARVNEMLERLSLLDALTEIANRRHFDLYLEKEWKRAAREHKPLALLFIDIDYFKDFNDSYGHQRGDECLQQVATVLTNTLKRPGDFVARYGGEEFAAVLPDTGMKGAEHAAEAMCAAIIALGLTHPRSPIGDRVTVSVGVSSVLPGPGLATSTLITAADKALYHAKQEGRNCVRSIGVA